MPLEQVPEGASAVSAKEKVAVVMKATSFAQQKTDYLRRYLSTFELKIGTIGGNTMNSKAD